MCALVHVQHFSNVCTGLCAALFESVHWFMYSTVQMCALVHIHHCSYVCTGSCTALFKCMQHCFKCFDMEFTLADATENLV